MAPEENTLSTDWEEVVKPAFEIHYPGGVCKIWPDGQILGFPVKYGSVFNRIPALLLEARSARR